MMNSNPQYPYSRYPNDAGSDPYPPASSSYPTPPSGPDDPTFISAGSNPYSGPYSAIPPAPPPPPRIRLFSAKVLLLIGLALLLVVGASIFGIVGLSQQTQIHTLQATATAVVRTQATAQAFTQATATAIASHYPFSDRLVLDDPMYDNSHGNQWAEIPNDAGGSCRFTQGTYHVSQTQVGNFYYCLAQGRMFSNFTFEVKMSFIKGSDGGIVFRADPNTSRFYYLVIGQDGRYFFFAYDGSHFHALISGSITHEISGFYTGPNQGNLIGVVARGSTLDLYANGQRYASVIDGTFSTGEIGVVASAFSQPTEVAFSDAKVWSL